MAGTCECVNEPLGSIMCREFLSSWKPFSFSGRTLLHGVSKLDTEPYITVFTKVKSPRGLSLQRTYITSSRTTLGQPGIWKWKWQTSCEDGWPYLELEGCGCTSCVTWTRLRESCYGNNMCVSFPAYDLWFMKVFRVVESSRWKKSFLGYCHMLQEMLLLFIISFTSTKPILFL